MRLGERERDGKKKEQQRDELIEIVISASFKVVFYLRAICAFH